MVTLAKITLIMLVAQACILSGVGLISGQLLPSAMAGFYKATTMLGRTAIASVTMFAVANYLVAYSYGHFSPAWVAPVLIAATVLANTVFALLVMQRGLSWQIALATLAVMLSCVWASRVLQGPPPV